jgi:hypothetical protein
MRARMQSSGGTTNTRDLTKFPVRVIMNPSVVVFYLSGDGLVTTAEETYTGGVIVTRTQIRLQGEPGDQTVIYEVWEHGKLVIRVVQEGVAAEEVSAVLMTVQEQVEEQLNYDPV